MRPTILSITLATLGITLSTMSLFVQPSYSSDTTFYCGQPERDDRGNLLTTLWFSPPHTRDIPLIQFSSAKFEKWRNNQGQQYRPDIRCETTKVKFQRYLDCNTNQNPLDIDFLATATYAWQEKGLPLMYYPVILTTLNPATMSRQCLGDEVEPNPKIEGLLFMLPPDRDINKAAATAQDALDKLEDIRFYAVGDPIQN